MSSHTKLLNINMHIYTVKTADKGQRLDKYIKRLLPQAPASMIYKNLRQRNILLNGKRATGSEIVATGDEVRLYLADETIEKFGGTVHGVMQDDLPGDRERHAPGRQIQKGIKQNASGQGSEGFFRPSVTGGAEAAAAGEKSSPSGKQAAIRGGSTDHFIGRVLDARQAARVMQRKYPSLRLVYEDRDIAAAYKPAGVLSQKARQDDLSMNEWFLGTLLERGEVTEESLHMFTPSVQNRLDRNTEGLILLAKSLQGSHFLTGLQRERSIHKYYVMIVLGQIRTGGEIAGWLSKDSASNRVTLYEEERPGTVYSQTVYRPLAWSKDAGLTGVEAELLTGRTHQLRAHMASIGHPILGDPKYGDLSSNAAYRKQGVTSQMLLCQRVEFPLIEGDFEYLSGRSIQTPLPEIYRKLMQ